MYKYRVRKYLECREANEAEGTAFYPVADVLRSPDLQARCIEKPILRRLFKKIDDDPVLAWHIQQLRD